MDRIFQSSGDLIADRRYQYGQTLFSKGDYFAAADLFEQVVEIAPNWPTAYFSLGRARREGGDIAAAAEAYRACLRLDPTDVLGASLALAAVDPAKKVDSAPPAYVRALFNAYAQDFDEALVERLAYSTPKKLAEAVRKVRNNGKRIARALDLGCGTGLAGEAISPDVDWLEGIDISDAMIEAARRKDFYQYLEVSDLVTALCARGEQYDLVIAADVLNYLGELEKVFLLIAQRLAEGGLAAFSVEKGACANWAVQPSLRFVHSEDYVRGVLSAAGLEVVLLSETTLRKERGEDVAGLIVAARKEN